MAELQKKASGVRKAAVLLVSLDKNAASKILKEFDQSMMNMILKEVVNIDNDPPSKEERDAVLQEYYKVLQTRHTLKHGGLDYARDLLFETLPKNEAESAFENLRKFLRGSPLSFLNDVNVDELIMFIQNEHPQTIALIVSQLDKRKASRILETLPVKRQVEVVRRIAQIESASEEILERLSGALRQKFTVKAEVESESGGIRLAADVLKHVSRATEKAVLDNLEETEPEIAQEIRNLMFTFEDILKVNDRGVQILLQNVDKQQLTLALKSCSNELKEKVFKNMSKRAQEDLKESLDLMGPVRLSDVESAQRQIVLIVKKLEEEGQLIIEGMGGEEVVA